MKTHQVGFRQGCDTGVELSECTVGHFSYFSFTEKLFCLSKRGYMVQHMSNNIVLLLQVFDFDILLDSRTKSWLKKVDQVVN